MLVVGNIEKIRLPRNILKDFFPVDQDLPLFRLQDSGEQLQEGALSGAVGADQAEDLPFPDLSAGDPRICILIIS